MPKIQDAVFVTLPDPQARRATTRRLQAATGSGVAVGSTLALVPHAATWGTAPVLAALGLALAASVFLVGPLLGRALAVLHFALEERNYPWWAPAKRAGIVLAALLIAGIAAAGLWIMIAEGCIACGG